MLKRESSRPVDFEKLDTDTLIMYSEFYMDKIDEGAPMDTYYRNMLYLVNLELEKRVNEKYNKSC